MTNKKAVVRLLFCVHGLAELKGLTISALAFGRICFVRAYLDFIERTVVFALCVVHTFSYVAFDAFVCTAGRVITFTHIKSPPCR